VELWPARAAVIAAIVALIAIRAPHGHRSRKVKVKRSAKGGLETGLLTLAWASFLLPVLWLASPWLDAANYPLRPAAYFAGLGVLAASLWMFHLSHRDLGTNWSITLELREEHRLVTEGVYRRVRHPMYLALILFSVGLALVLPNAVAGPAYLVVMLLLFAFRVGPEERLMREEFGPAWDAYAARTKRLVPGVW
jgi:protein-S-isoprenylcysteine O-methyltransferase Ste14